MFEVWLCVIEVVEQNVKLMLTTHYFTKKIQSWLFTIPKEILKRTHGELAFQVGLQIDILTEQLYKNVFRWQY